MPEYLAPGVYVEERSFRSKSIEGVSTSTTGFVGATRFGPIEGEPELITNFPQFERIYGGRDPLTYGDIKVQNYLAHAAKAFFDNGGSRLYIARAYTFPTSGDGIATAPIPPPAPLIGEVDTAATAATNSVLGSLGQAVTALQQAKAGAVMVLQFAAAQVLDNLETTAPPTLTYDYGSGDDIGTQLTNFINGLPDGDEKTNLQSAFTDTWQAVIDPADDHLKAANAALADAAAAQVAVSEAYGNGVDEGEDPDDDDVSGMTPDPSALSTAGAAATNAANTVAAAADGLAAPSAALADSLAVVADETTASTAVSNAQTLITTAQAVITPATEPPTDADGAIQTAARTATLERRISTQNANAGWEARYPGAAGNMTVIAGGRLDANVLFDQSGAPGVRQLRNGDLAVINRGGAALIYGATRSSGSWSFTAADGTALPLSSLNPATDAVYPLKLTIELELPDKTAQPMVWAGLTVSDRPDRSRDSVTQLFQKELSNRMQALETPLVLSPDAGLQAAQLAANLINLDDWTANLAETPPKLTQAHSYELSGGSDGQRPDVDAYVGSENTDTGIKSGLKSFEDLEEISIIAAPGYSHDYTMREAIVQQINQELIIHCENMRYRVAVLDSPNNQALSGVRDYRAKLDSKYAAVYYPWVRIYDSLTDQEVDLPPSGFIAGIYARNDNQIGVHKAPANEPVRGAIGLETLINKAQQDVLNPLGINCIRFFEGRGVTVWGARTISFDPEWKYLNIRRYFVYLEASIDRSTQWAVFEPNGEALWLNVRRTVENFLESEWREGRLAGATVDKAFFVKCDRSTMSQNDLDNGRMICLIGVAPLYPAEFVIFRIGQWTADGQ